MAVEQKRGCGYRQAGGLYLVGDLSGAVPVEFLPTCIDYPQSRSVAWVDPMRLLRNVPTGNGADQYRARPKVMLMWVGATHYTPASFLAEAQALGVSKRVAAIPADALPGDPIALAHPAAVPTVEGMTVDHPLALHCPSCRDVPAATALTNAVRLMHRGHTRHRMAPTMDPMAVAGVFCLFTLRGVELVLPRTVAADPDIARRCAAKGVTIVPVPDGDQDHVPAGWQLPSWLRDDEPSLPGILNADTHVPRTPED